ncbi:hypothetical protein FDC45_13770 [Clostridium botulinum]|uniref:Uncharacterized protein n=1 Tax=Clostridium botulinum TaxID=1491 RepID=A0A846JGK3_CLOBO|nr:CDP-glycerol glycerophosphotransferase family protein [Clostridium botulinum]ACA57000.1 CDP-Glycerol:Poly(glycerophosphate) glycerophosphotransferase family [Clostridium botulinum A3 str. Loch Maree]NFJ09095.1 hypothetical protein [Clostridium botulinum]NFK13637.1 hypothetical protein [Clostridium botulinum]NFM95178.1 hypothetical protein [Clostridium botulinum]NFO18399.1 hypothetical protein [Clostridium botulinum]
MKLYYVLSKDKKEVIYKKDIVNIEQCIAQISDEEVNKYLEYIENQQWKVNKIINDWNYEGINFYQFFKNVLKARLKHLFYCIKIINKFYNENMKVITDSNMMLRVAKEIFHLKCEEIEPQKKCIAKVEYSIYKEKNDIRLTRGYKNYEKFKRIKNDKKNFLFFTHAMDINLIKSNKNEYSYVDTQLGPIIKELEKYYNVLNIQLCSDTSLDKCLSSNIEYVPLEIVNEKAKDIELDKKLFYLDYNTLENIEYIYNGLNLKEFILKYIYEDVEYICVIELKKILSIEKIIEENEVEGLIAMDERGSGKSFIIAGNKKNIKTYAVQHGLITEKNGLEELVFQINKLHVPEKTFLWGEYFRQSLLNYKGTGYNNKNTEVVGQVRTDLLSNYFYYNSNSKLDKNNFKILYATNGIKFMNLEATEILFKALFNLKSSYNLIIKLHPNDRDYDYYEKKVKEYNLSNVKILKDGDLYELLNWSQLIVAISSTVVVEGLIFNKPSVCIDVTNYEDLSGYVKNKIAFGAKNEFELLDAITRCKNINMKEYGNVEKFIRESFYKIDGNVTKRIIESILDEQ